MELETEKIDLGKGGWAVVYKDVLRVTSRLHEAEIRKVMKPVDDQGKVLLSELDEAAEAPKIDYQVDYNLLDNDAINEIYIFHQVKEWAFGPIDLPTLETKVTREQYKTLVKEMDRLYKPLPLPDAG